jgi:hypothetical protein
MSIEGMIAADANQEHVAVLPGETLYAPRPGLRPYRQGDLDALCGLYAIINAARWAAWPKEIAPEFAETLFAKLGHHAAMALGMPALCAMGTTVPQLRRLIRLALAMLQSECGIELRLEAIPAKALRITLRHGEAPGIIASARLGEAFVVHITHGVGHWTVFERIDGTRARFFDSAGWRSLSLRRVKFSSAFRLAIVGNPQPRMTRPMR